MRNGLERYMHPDHHPRLSKVEPGFRRFHRRYQFYLGKKMISNTKSMHHHYYDDDDQSRKFTHFANSIERDEMLNVSGKI